MQPCPNICSTDDKNCPSRDLLEELNDLKAMLEMQEIINLEQEEKLKRCNEETEKLTNEKNCCVTKISEMEKEMKDKTSFIQSLHEKIAELEEQFNEARQNLCEEREKVERLTKYNENLSQNLEKKAHKIKNIERQLEDERSFYAEEKARYCKEMKRRIYSTTEVQTDCLTIDDNSVYTLNSDEVIAVMKRLKALYNYQLIVNLRICEKYIKLRRRQDVLQSRLKRTTHAYKTEMCDIKRKFDECRYYYEILMEGQCNEGDILKIMNRYNRSESENAVLKQELLHLDNCLSIMKSKRNLNDDVTYQNEQFSKYSDEKDIPSLKKNEIRRTSRSKRKNKTFSNTKKNSSSPVISENDSSDYYVEKNNHKILAECQVHEMENNKGELTDSSNELLEESDTSTVRNYDQINICPSFSSFSSVDSSKMSNEKEFKFNENYESKKKIVNSNEIIDERVIEANNKNYNGKSTRDADEDEPACLQVNCDQIKTDMNRNCQIITPSTKNTVNTKEDLQEWLANTAIIDCTNWSNSVQGSDVMKTESAPELFQRSPTS